MFLNTAQCHSSCPFFGALRQTINHVREVGREKLSAVFKNKPTNLLVILVWIVLIFRWAGVFKLELFSYCSA